jgi:hypothetical protein
MHWPLVQESLRTRVLKAAALPGLPCCWSPCQQLQESVHAAKGPGCCLALQMLKEWCLAAV